MLGIPANNLLTLNVAHVVVQDLLAQKINESLDSLCHLLWLYSLIVVLHEAGEVKIRVGHLKALDVKSVLEKDAHIIKGLCLAEVLPDLVSKDQNSLDNLLLVEFVVFLIHFLTVVHIEFSALLCAVV